MTLDEAPLHVGEAVLACILQLEGKEVVASIPSKFCVTGVVLGILVCANDWIDAKRARQPRERSVKKVFM